MEEMRLQKYLARAGVASRRACEAYISVGRVTVNGELVTELGAKVRPGSDAVAVDGAPVELPAEQVAIMLHKPAGYTTTMSDPHAERTVAELVPAAEYPGLYPIGRLDADTTGLLLFSTDGELGNALLHPSRHVLKRYLALVEGRLTKADAERLAKGVRLSDGMTLPAEVRVLSGADAERAAVLIGSGAAASGSGQRHAGRRSRAVLEKSGSYVEVGLREGRKRQVRRMLEAVGHPVIALHREALGSLNLDGLARGSWRVLSEDEVRALREASGA